MHTTGLDYAHGMLTVFLSVSYSPTNATVLSGIGFREGTKFLKGGSCAKFLSGRHRRRAIQMVRDAGEIPWAI